MNIAQLTIELSANVARLSQDMQAARGVVERNARAMQSAADLAGKALGALGIGLSVAAFTGFIRGAIDAADAAGKLSASTGIAVKDLAGLQMTYEQGGLGQDVFAKSTAKLSKAIADGSVALDAMGVKTRDAAGNLRSTKDVIYEVSDRFADYADGANKAALAQEIFGKSGAEMIPLLNAGSAGMIAAQEAAEQLGLTISEETATKAAEFNDTLDTLQRGLGGVATRVAAELVPTLSTLAAELLTTTTNSGVLEGAANALSTALKGLYSSGLGIVQVFKTVGTALGGAAAGVAALASGKFAEANAIGNQLSKDISDSWTKSGETIQRVWQGAGNAVLQSVVKSGAAAKEQAPNVAALTKAHASGAAAAKKAAAEMEKAAEAQRKLVEEGVKLAASLLAQDGGLSGDFAEKWKKLNAAYDGSARSLANLTKAQSLLLADQPAMKAAVEERKKQLDDEAAAWADVRKAMAAYGQAQEQAAQGVADGNKSLREEIELIGLSGKEQTRVLQQRTHAIVLTKQHTLAEMERQAVITGTMTREQIALAAEIEGLQERNELLGAKEARESWTGFWESVNSTAHDTFVNVAEEGMGAFSRIGKTLKSAVLDALYQMTAKQWIIGISASGAGGAAMAGGGGGSGMGSTLSTLGSLSSGMGLLGAGGLGMQAGFGALMSSGFAGIGASVTGGMAAIASGTGAGIAAGLGTIAGALGPVALGVGALFSIIKKFDNSGTLHMGAGAIYSADKGLRGGQDLYYSGSDKFGMAAKYNPAAQGNVDSIARGIGMALDSVAVSFGQKAGYEIATAFADDSSKDGAWGQLRISQAGKDLMNWEDARKSKWAPKEFGNGDAGYKEYLAAVAKDTRQVLLDMDLPSWADTMLNSIGEAADMDALTAVIGQIAQIQSAFEQMGRTLDGFAELSGEAFEALMKASGGMEALSASAAGYYDSYYSEAERMGKATAQLTIEFAKAGIGMPRTKEAYRALVEEQLRAGEGGAALAAKLLQLAPAFATTADYAAQAALAIEEAFANISKTTAQSVRDVQLSIMDNAQKYSFLDSEINSLIGQLSNATLPEEIERLFNQANQATTSAYGLLDPDEQRRLNSQFVDRLYELEAISQSRLDVAGPPVVQQQAQAAADAKAAAAEQRVAAAQMAEAAGQMFLAAQESLRAAQTTRTIEVRVQGGGRAANEVTYA